MFQKLVPVAKRCIPVPVKSVLRSLQTRMLDLSDADERRKNMIPPRSMNFVGNGDFTSIGLEFRALFTEYGGLKPEHRVLDVGCGIGRMAVPLTSFLSEKGEYEGFDIVKKGVEWCQGNITPRYRNFHFSLSDVQNKYYNPEGTYQASSYRFPYEDNSFDFIFLTSVFTHMFPTDLEHYLEEIGRVLKRGGRFVITFFLMNGESEGLIRKKLSSQAFIHEIGGCFTTTMENPEAAIAYPETYVRALFSKLGLTIEEPIHYGSWCGRSKFLSYQDVIVGEK